MGWDTSRSTMFVTGTTLMLAVMCLVIRQSTSVPQFASFGLATSQNYDYTFEPGSSHEFTHYINCIVFGVEDNTVSWIKNRITISDGYEMRNVSDIDTRYSIYRGPSGTSSVEFSLQIDTVSANHAAFDSGYYQCVVHDSNDIEILSSPITVLTFIVTPINDRSRCHHNHEVIVENEEVILTCTHSDATAVPLITLTWYMLLNNRGVVLSSSNPSVVEGVLTITYTWIPKQTDESIEFVCLAYHPSWGGSKSCQLGPFTHIYSKPNVTLQRALRDRIDPILYEDSTVFICNASGDPDEFTYSWRFDNMDIADQRFSLNNDATQLSLADVSFHDNGVHIITCMVNNSVGVGSAFVEFNITVPKPTAENHPETTRERSVDEYYVRGTEETYTSVVKDASHGADTSLIGAAVGAGVGGAILFGVGAVIIIWLLKFRRKQRDPIRANEKIDNADDYSEMPIMSPTNAENSRVLTNHSNVVFSDGETDLSVNVELAMTLGSRENKPDACVQHLYDQVKQVPRNVNIYAEPSISTTHRHVDYEDDTTKKRRPILPPKPGPVKSVLESGETRTDDGPIILGEPSPVSPRKDENNTDVYENNMQQPELMNEANNVDGTMDSFMYANVQSRVKPQESQSNEGAAVDINERMLRNVEGLSYADLEFSDSTPPIRASTYANDREDVLYAELKL